MTTVPAAGAYAAGTEWEDGVAAIDGAIGVLRILRTLPESELTISGGSVTPTQANHTIDTENDDPADTLNTLVTDNIPDGACVWLRQANAARIVTIAHNASGDGEVFLADDRDLVWPASTEPVLCLIRRGADWHELYRVGFGFPVESVAATPHTLTDAELSMPGATYDNTGAGAEIEHTLPTARAGLEATFVVTDTDGIKISAATGDTIRIGGSVSASAGYVRSATIGDAITLRAVDDSGWVAVSVVPTTADWTIDS